MKKAAKHNFKQISLIQRQVREIALKLKAMRLAKNVSSYRSKLSSSHVNYDVMEIFARQRNEMLLGEEMNFKMSK